jgi:hypothetical protein
MSAVYYLQTQISRIVWPNEIHISLFFSYFWDVKKIIPIFLFAIICINHLNIIDAVLHFSARFNKENVKLGKSLLEGKESEPEKETKEKAKTTEEEKFLQKNHNLTAYQFQLPGKDKNICFNTTLNKHPYTEDDIQPPKAV